MGVARDTWKFFAKDVDPKTHLPLDNIGPGSTRGNYTSAANVGVYLWAVVAARDLHIISDARADALRQRDLARGAANQARLRFHVPVVQHRQRHGDPEPECRHLRRRSDRGHRQLLVPVGGRQRLVRLWARRGSAGAAEAAQASPPACSAR